jgi:DNA ligase-1
MAERLKSAEAIIAKMGTVVAQYKYDGLRAHIHKDGQQITIFSRNLEDQSHMFPEPIEGTLKQVRAERAI